MPDLNVMQLSIMLLHPCVLFFIYPLTGQIVCREKGWCKQTVQLAELVSLSGFQLHKTLFT